MMIPIPIPIPMPIHRFSHLSVRMSARIASISINLIFHITCYLDATIYSVCDCVCGNVAWLPARHLGRQRPGAIKSAFLSKASGRYRPRRHTGCHPVYAFETR